MATTYKFQISLPVTDLAARNRIVNTIHLQHVTSADEGGLTDMCSDIAQLYQARYDRMTTEIDVRAYDVDAVPNYPRAQVVVNPGQAWPINVPREIAICLSYAGEQRGNKSERGRIYLVHGLMGSGGIGLGARPTQAQLDWALEWYTLSNESLPDLGGIDWKFGVWSRRYQKFTQTEQAWVNDDWDVQRRRGLRESTRVTAQREG